MSSHRLPKDMEIGPFEICDPGTGNNLLVDRWGQHVPLDIDDAGETNTLIDPSQAGQRVCIFAAEVAASATRTVTAQSSINASGSTYMLFDAVDELAILESFPVGGGDYEWRAIVESGVVIG